MNGYKLPTLQLQPRVSNLMLQHYETLMQSADVCALSVLFARII